MRVYVEGVGLLGPGLSGWQAGRAALAEAAPYAFAPTVVSASELLPAAERRRTGAPVKLALAVGREAFMNAGRDPSITATVFTSSGGDGENVHQICETLASTDREVSPTRFHNSVHNAAAGYWGIATGSREPSTSLCGYDASFAAGLLEAAAQVCTERAPLGLIAYDHRYPQPINAVRPLIADFAVALILTPERTDRTFAALAITHVHDDASATAMTLPALETVRAGVPAARSLPLLAAFAREAAAVVMLELAGTGRLRVEIAPC